MKIGVVPYLNAYPLYYFLDHPVIKATPVRLSQMMESGDLDLALLPVFTYFQNPNWKIIPQAGGISSNGPVKSVMIFYKEEIEKPANIKTIHYTTDSKTSVGLTKVLRKFYWQKPDFIETKQDPDAILEIGDRALTFNQKGYKVIDLGETWTHWTKLPFVYAAWISRVDPTAIEDKLTKAKEKGVKNINQLIKLHSEIPEEIRKKYLTENIQFELNENALKGMKLYQNYLLEL